jgi:hypothetical protein
MTGFVLVGTIAAELSLMPVDVWPEPPGPLRHLPD